MHAVHVFIVLLWVFAATLGTRALAQRWLDPLDPAEAWGVAGLLGLGLLGTLTYLLGWWISVPVALGVVHGVVALALGFALFRGKGLLGAAKFDPRVLALLPAMVIGLLHTLAPLDALDWDGLAYHLAVPKIWAQEGRITFIPTIHHSNFPFNLDALNLLFPVGSFGEAVKAFSFAPLVFGCLAVFGLTRRWFGGGTGLWAALAFAYTPVLLWQAGSTYIDLAHGLFSGLALLYLAEKIGREQSAVDWALPAALLGLACGSKYTGWQAVLAAFVVTAVFLARTPGGWRALLRGVAVVGLTCAVLGGPFLVRNVLNTSNPVYPFLYEVFGGRNWDAWRADIYKNEQQSFGLGRAPSALAPAVVGLAYQPGRYINPGQASGQGFPMGATGAVPVLALGLGALLGLRDRRWLFLLTSCGLLFGMWFVLSQQVRYLAGIWVIAAVVAGGFLAGGRARVAVRWLIGLQAVVTSVVLWQTVTFDHLGSALSPNEVREQIIQRRVAMARNASAINQAVQSGKVALFDEVFGYELDCRYVWGNPPHSTLFPSENARSVGEFLKLFDQEGVTHFYVNLGYMPDFCQNVLKNSASAEDLEKVRSDRQIRWVAFISEAAQAGKLRSLVNFGGAVLYERVRSSQ